MIEISDYAENFPDPQIRHIPRSNICRRNVISDEDGQVERKVVMETGGGLFLEIGRKLSPAIFGYVVHASLVHATNFNTNGGDVTFRRSNDFVAIKVYMKRELRRLTGRTEEDHINEITALQYIGNSNPNLIGQLECCEDDDNVYLIMRYCPGGELYTFINTSGPFDEARARGMMKQLINGMLHLQQLGVGHRDMSLENILFDEHQELFIIIDFGMCKRCRLTTAALTSPPQFLEASSFCHIRRLPTCGKRNYIAPEVLPDQGDMSFNPILCDVWALGIILFIVLTGVPPVDAALETDDRFRMIAEGRLREMVLDWGFDLSREVLDLIQNILRPEPDQRLTLSRILSHPWMMLG